jgi:hypothetical protein
MELFCKNLGIEISCDKILLKIMKKSIILHLLIKSNIMKNIFLLSMLFISFLACVLRRMKNIFIFLLHFNVLFGQDFDKASLRLINGDSLLGFVQRLSESKMSKEIYFSLDKKGTNPTKYLPFNIKSLYFLEEKIYFEPVLYTFKADSVRKEEYRLAKVMLKGNCNLYKMQLPFKEQKIIFEEDNTFVYIVRKKGEDYVLDVTEKILNTPRNNAIPDGYKKDNRYRNILWFVMSDVPSMKEKIDILKFNDKAITGIIKSYNTHYQGDIASVDYQIEVKTQKKSLISVGIGIFQIRNKATSLDTIFSAIEIAYFRQKFNPELNEKMMLQYGLGFRRVGTSNFLRLAIFSHIYHKNALKKGAFLSVGGSADWYLNEFLSIPTLSPSIGFGYEINKIQAKISYENILFRGNGLKIAFGIIF